jgi:hypothetical protein
VDTTRNDTSDKPTLSERNERILEFETRFWRRWQNKEAAIREEFDLHPVRYYQVLNLLLDHPIAAERHPELIKRLRLRRERRRVARSGGDPSQVDH